MMKKMSYQDRVGANYMGLLGKIKRKEKNHP